jgi:branched-subunit amino acid transport protein
VGDISPRPERGVDVISDGAVWATVAVAGVGTYLIRWSFLALAHRATDLPPLALRILRMIPPAALAALVTPGLLRPDDRFDPLGAEALAGLVAGLVAWRTKSVIWPLVVGLPIALALG